jgi:uncharacterized protein
MHAFARWAGILLLGLSPALATALSPTDIVSPRPDSWVRDDAGMLGAASADIDARIDAARAAKPVELAVVTVVDIGDQDPRQFATELFNHWGIGDPQRHDGVLLFIAREQRAAEIILGEGVDSDAEVAISRQIMDGVLIPHLRRGDAGGGALASVEALLQQIHGIAPPAVEQDNIAVAPVASPSSSPQPLHAPAEPAPTGALDGVAQRLGVAKEPLLFGGGVLGLLGALALRWWWRIRGRNCPRCNAAMLRLEETADDAHLNPAQQLEEKLGSVDYDVWACSACTFVDTRRYGSWFTRYARCGKCQTVALEREQTTLEVATYTSGGRVRVDERCKHCGHHHSYTRSTPRKTKPRSGGSGRSGFSGGRSSGRGASGRW